MYVYSMYYVAALSLEAENVIVLVLIKFSRHLIPI